MNPNRWVAQLLGVILWGMGSGFACGQTILATPSLTISEEYDDNIRLASKSLQSDFVTGVRPGLSLEIKDQPWYLTLAGALRWEFFAKHGDLNTTTELNTITDNAEGSATLEYRPTPVFSLSVADSFSQSVNAALVAPEIGITTGRFTSTSNAVSPAASYQITSRTTARGHYTFRILRSDAPDSRDSDTHEAAFSLERQITPRTSGRLAYTFTRFEIEGSASRDSHSPRLGLVVAHSPTIRFSSDTGLLLLEREDGSEEVTLASSTRYEQEFRQGRLSLGYERNATTAGVFGVVSVSQGFTGAATYQPTRALTLSVEGSIVDTESSGPSPARADFLAYSTGLRISYRLFRWLSIEGSYRYQRQDDRVGTRDLTRNVFFLGLTASDQFRVH